MNNANNPIPDIKAIDSRRQYWQRNSGLWLLAFAMCVFSLFILNEIGFQRGFDRIYRIGQQQADNELNIQTLVLESRLEKYRLLPVLMARQSEFIRDASITDSMLAENWLKQLNYITGSYDVLLADASGEILVNARHSNETLPSLTNNDLINAPLQSRLGRSYLITTENQPIYGFSARVAQAEQPPLILIFLVSLSPVVESWSLSSAQMTAQDQHGTIRLASNPDWIGQDAKKIQPPHASDYALASLELKTIGWRISALQPIEQDVLFSQIVLSSLLVCLTILIFFALFIRRKELQIKQILRDQLYAKELENQINFRTAELATANQNLTDEINDRRRAEQRLKTKQQELIHSAKLATIGQMSTTLSHEYNQPLAAMRTYTENAIRFLEKQRIEPVEENLKRILQQADRLGNLSKTLLSFAGKPTAPMGPVNISACVNETIMLVQPKIRQHNIRIEQDIQASLFIKGHSVQFSQVMLNLLTNAVDALKENTSAHGVIRLKAVRENEFICLTAEDNGPGIDQAIKTTLFDPFVTTKPSGKGLGLGLSIIRDIITEHQGTLQVTDSPLGGACFTIHWPIWDSADL